MTVQGRALWREALSLMSPALVLKQMALAAVVALLAVVWLRLPDSNVLWVVVSLLLGAVVLCVAGGGEAALLLELAGQPRTGVRLLRGVLLLLVAALLWCAVSSAIDHMQVRDSLRAGYDNSRFSASSRHYFTFENILAWLGWMWTAMRWICGSVLGAAFIAPIAVTRARAAIVRTLRSLTYWIATALLCFGGCAVTGALVGWTPGHGLKVELVSVGLRLLCAFVVDAVLVCLVLAVIVACGRKADLAYKAEDGTPVGSQPRTVEIP